MDEPTRRTAREAARKTPRQADEKAGESPGGRAAALLRWLHDARNDFHGGGGDTALRTLLSADVSWRVPGHNAIAGHHEGIEAVLEHFARCRDLTAGTLRLRPRDLLTGHGEWVASITDGEAVIGGRPLTWSAVGLYRLREGKVAACRLLPVEPETFDAVWAAPGPAGAVSLTRIRVRPRHCDAQAMVHAGRYPEFFEDAFVDWLEEHAGGYDALRSGGADLVIVATGCDHHGPARLGETLTVRTRPARAGSTSLMMIFTVQGGHGDVATGRITYAVVGARGRAMPLPEVLRSAATTAVTAVTG